MLLRSARRSTAGRLAFLILLVTPLCVLPATSTPAGTRDLTFEERVAAEEAIQRVYHSHRAGDTRSFGEAVPRETLEARVDRYLRQSALLEEYWNNPVTGDMLHAEIRRIARDTHFPERLRQIYAALDHDPVLVEECFARPILVDRLATGFFAFDDRVHGEARHEAEVLLDALRRGEDPPEGLRFERIEGTAAGHAIAGADRGSVPEGERIREGARDFRVEVPAADGAGTVVSYVVRKRPWNDWWAVTREEVRRERVPTVSHGAPLPDPGDPAGEASAACIPDDTWDNGSFFQAPSGRSGHTAIWTGTHMIVWGGSHDAYVDSGAIYDPLTDAWSPTSLDGAPSPRGGHTAVWTGTEMIVWGGGRSYATVPITVEYEDKGGRYDPATDTWTPTSTTGAPSPRRFHAAVWTGSQMLVVGGEVDGSTAGGRYDPATDIWTPMSTTNQHAGAPQPATVWTGSEMIVWGGSTTPLNTGARYDPTSDLWTPMSTTDAPAARFGHTMVWSGTEILVYSGEDGVFPPSQEIQDGGRYDPVTDTWTVLPEGPSSLIPRPRSVWTGDEMLVWSGYVTGGRYDPVASTWSTISSTNAPSGTGGLTALWGADRMIVWGGNGANATGGRYDPVTDTWTPTATTTGPTPRAEHAAVWTGTEMLLWGGFDDDGSPLTDGDRYDPLADAWTPLPSTGAPNTTIRPAVVWTGRRMLVWGSILATEGARYDPVREEWTPMSTAGAPGPRERSGFAWTGTDLVIWGGLDGSTILGDGARYDPIADVWSPMTAVNAPSPRFYHGLVRAGSEVAVWGGFTTGSGYSNTGAFYDPSMDSWRPMTTLDAPTARQAVSLAWTGEALFVWGGFGDGGSLASGGLYDPAADTWVPVTPAGEPSPRALGAVVWTGRDLLVWGGVSGRSFFADGARYDPDLDGWTPMSLAGAPEGRYLFSAVWTGSDLLIWGGDAQIALGDGGRYALHQADDVDGDGHSVCAGDCDDSQPLAFPGGTEACDFIDNDCDGVVDDGFDVDGDGFTTCNGDCNDGAASAFPGNPETCDALDNDCDGTADGFATSCGMGECAAVGTCNLGIDSCTPGTPTAEICDGLDNDCDGSIPVDEADADGDGWSVCAGDCAPSDPDVSPTAPEINNALDEQCPGYLGSGLVDELSGTAGLLNASDTSEFCWEAQSGATLYQFGRSDLPFSAPGCVGGTTTDLCWHDVVDPAVGETFFYEARSVAPNVGAWGPDGTGSARPSICQIEVQCADGLDNDGDGKTDCEDLDDCFGRPACPSVSFSFIDTFDDDISTTAILDAFQSVPAQPSHYIHLAMDPGGVQPFEWCADRADVYRSNYLTLAPTGGEGLGGYGSLWSRTNAGPWVGPEVDAYSNYYGTYCGGAYAWCSQYGFGSRAPTLDPSQTGVCEAYDLLYGCLGGETTVTITIGVDRLSACGF